MQGILLILAVVLGPVIGAFFVWLVLRNRAKSYRERRSDMEAVVFALQQQLQSKDRHVQELESRLNSAQSEAEALKVELETKSGRESVSGEKQLGIAEVESALQLKDQALTQLQSEHAELQKLALALEASLKEKEQQLQELNQLLRKARSETNRLKEQFKNESEKLAATIEAKDQHIAELEAMLEKKEKALDRIEQDLQDSHAELQATDELIRKTLRGGPKLHHQTVEAHDKLIRDIQERLERFEQKFSQPEFSDVVHVINPEKLSENFRDLKEKDLQPAFVGFRKGFRHLFGGWLGDIKKEYVEQSQKRLERIRRLKSGGPYTILVVNNERPSSEQLATILESEGYTVYTADHKEQGVTLAIEHRPHLIFVDTMSDMSGFDLTREIKGAAELSNIPIIITAYATEPIVQKSVDAGAVDVITKPFRRLIVLEKILHHLAQPV